MGLHRPRHLHPLVGIWLQITIVMASSAFDYVVFRPVESLTPASVLPTFSSLMMMNFLAKPNATTGRRALTFATRQSSRYNRKGRYTTVSLPRLAPSQYSASDDEILTPETYADSRMAKRQVKDIIASVAFEAFESTDFAHEPHLSPELEDAETAFEVALLASAAHELADAAEKENRQSKAAMLERERELEWIEKHEDDENNDENGDEGNAAARKAEAFQRSLLAAQLANVHSQRTAKKRRQVAFQRSLLSARIANDIKARGPSLVELDRQRKEEWLGSEARAASMGGQECLPFNVASAAASSAAAHAMAESEAEGNEVVVVGDEKGGYETTPVAAASIIADAAERMILGQDIAYDIASLGHSQDEQEKEQRSVVPGALDNDDSVSIQTQLSVQQEVLTEVDQWRKDYVHDIRNYVQQKGIEQTEEKFSLRNSSGGDGVGSENTAVNSINTAIAVDEDTNSGDDNVIKRALQRGFVRRMRQQRRLLGVAMAMVIGRRFFLALSGNALRLI